MSDEEFVLFDPGIGRFVQPFYTIAESTEAELAKIKAFHVKKSKYHLLYTKLYSAFINNIAFYNGCLSWAFYIKNFSDTPKHIINNPFLGTIVDNSDSNNLLLYLERYISKLEKNEKYYFNKTLTLDPYYKKVTVTYQDFMKLNNNFTQTETTEDLKLPENLIEYTEEEGQSALNAVNTAIENKQLESLLDYKIIK